MGLLDNACRPDKVSVLSARLFFPVESSTPFEFEPESGRLLRASISHDSVQSSTRVALIFREQFRSGGVLEKLCIVQATVAPEQPFLINEET